MGEKSMTDTATNATAGAGILQFFLPALNTGLQTVFLLVSIVWVGTQIYYKWFKDKPNNGS
jgi:hypothetical protein